MPSITTAELMIVQALTRELATEIDLHYDEEDRAAVAGTVDIISSGRELLIRKAIEVPAAVDHVIVKFARVNN